MTEIAASVVLGQNVEVTSTSQPPPTVTLEATLVAGSLAITADQGATAMVNVVAAVAGTLTLDANGGTIEVTSLVGAIAPVSVDITDGGTFAAESSYISLMSNTQISFGANVGAINTLRLDNSGSALNFSDSSALAGVQTGGEDVIDDNLILGASVASYAITQAGSTQADVLTFYDVNGASLGSLSFTAGTFNVGELGSFAVGYVGGPLQMTVASGGGTMTTTNGDVLDGGGFSMALGAGTWETLDNTGGTWDTITGSQGNVYITNAQGSIVGGDNAVYFDNSPGDAVSLYGTNNLWDSVYGSGAEVILTNAKATITGGGMTIYGNAVSDVSLAGTNGTYDAFYGSNDMVVLTTAQAAISGANNIIFANSQSAVSLFNTNNNWDTFTGSNDLVILSQAQASVIGGANTIYATGGSSASLYSTANAWDLFNGSNDAISLTSSQCSIVGAGDTIYSDSHSSVSLYSTAGLADVVYGSGVSVNLTNAQASVVGNGGYVYMAGQSTASLVGSNFSFNFTVQMGVDVVNGFNTSDTLTFSATEWTNFAALQSSGDLFESNGNAVIKLNASDSVTLTGVQLASLGANQFYFAPAH